VLWPVPPLAALKVPVNKVALLRSTAPVLRRPAGLDWTIPVAARLLMVTPPVELPRVVAAVPVVLMVVVPVWSNVPVPVMPPLNVLAPVKIDVPVTAKDPPRIVAPVPTVKVFVPEILVLPLRVVVPAIVVLPLSETAPVPVPNVPAPVWAKLPLA